MLNGIKEKLKKTLRCAAALPLRFLPAEQRAHLLPWLASELLVEVPVENGILRFNASTPTLYRRAKEALDKEPDTIAWIGNFSAGDVFWDVGANVGVFSLYAGTRPGVTVIAFEPSADNFAVLCANILHNGKSGMVVPYCLAFTEKSGLGLLNSPNRDVGAALHQFGAAGTLSRYWKGAVSHAQGMVGFSIDDFVAQFSPPFPTHLKLDVDGIERPILEGARKTLRDPRLRSLMVELNLTDKAEFDRASQLLLAAGFVCVKTGQKFLLDEEVAVNHFFARKET